MGASRGVRAGGIGGLGLLVVIVLALFFGVDPTQFLVGPDGASVDVSGMQEMGAPAPPADDAKARFVAVVLADTEAVWGDLFAAGGSAYREPTLTLFSGAVQSACGYADSAVGPFYCPGDQKVYIDLSFFDQLARRFGAPGDFAQAYVIAHEVGHHVQNLIGVMDQVNRLRSQASDVEANALSVRLELQADCFAGVWTHHAEQRFSILEPGDLEEALDAASAIGDDTLQRQAQGYVVPDSFTHGSSAQRVQWFRTGFETGDIQSCDTFRAGR